MNYFAHTSPDPRHRFPQGCQLLKDHLLAVARLARQFAERARPMHAQDDVANRIEKLAFHDAAFSAGLLHDFGKYQAGFQKYLKAAASGHPALKVPHAPVGACFGQVLGFPISGHHQGIPARPTVVRYQKEWDGVKKDLWKSATADLAALDAVPFHTLPDAVAKDPLRSEILIRMLFSCLVDADWCDTNAWSEQRYPYAYAALPLNPAERLAAVERHLAQKPAAGDVNAVRRAVLRNCRAAAAERQGFFTLTVPTGGGKTLASLVFALAHCQAHEGFGGAERIIYVIPFLNVIEQTSDVFHDALRAGRGEGIIFEHHSLARADARDAKGVEPPAGEEPETPATRRMQENWDAPIVLTTSVQFFESLFSNRPAAARKLHHIARTVVIFDECQTFPEGLYGPTIATLRELVERWAVTVVFCTATQPAIKAGASFARGIPSTAIHEIMLTPSPREIFRAMHRLRPGDSSPRVEVQWPNSRDDCLSWSDLAATMRQSGPALAIVNLKRDAARLFEALGGRPGSNCPDDVFYLSTLMCAEHRRSVLAELKNRLSARNDGSIEGRSKCYVSATQLVEAGVDFDFPMVFRAFGPLDSIGQAAGRCNREGQLVDASGEPCAGRLTVFRPPAFGNAARGYPTLDYAAGASVTEELLTEARAQGKDGPDLFDPQTYERYFTILLARLDTDTKGITEMRRRFDFPSVDEEYRLIDGSTEQVIVPFSKNGERQSSPVHQVIANARSRGYVSRDAARLLQPYLVNLWPHEFHRACYERPRLVEEVASGWWEWTGRYDPRCGLMFELDILGPV